MSGPPELTLFIGRLHPLLVHLPIGVILLLAILELLALFPRLRNANASARYILAFAIPLAAFTVLCGWLLSLGGGYGQRLLQWHKWTGIATAAVCAIAGLFYWLNQKGLYRASLLVSIIALVVASHFGGSLTHGSDYLVRYAPLPLRTWLGGSPSQAAASQIKREDLPKLHAFADLVQPAIQHNCVSCHGPEKAEAELRVDSVAALLKGGKSGPAIVAGKSGESPLLKRLRLPLNDKEHMPPEGKPQPASDQLALMQWWIDVGAPADKTLAELNPPARITRLLYAHYGIGPALAKAEPPRPLPEILPAVAKLADELNIALTPLSPNEPWLQCNASIAGRSFDDASLIKLASVAANLRWLDLAGTSITDSSLTQISAMPNLVRLHLERTSITDSGLAHLSVLPNLEYLNLYGTEITDHGLEQLQTLPKLKQLYLWQTKVTPSAVKAFAVARTDEDELATIKDEIARLQLKIKNDQFLVEVGIPFSNAAAAAAINIKSNQVPALASGHPLNNTCPVSGKKVDPTKTVLFEGKVIAFCCDDCKAEFQRDPAPMLAKLGLAAQKGP